MKTGSWNDPAHEGPADTVRIRGLGLKYGSFTALDSVNLTLPPGEVFGLLGPNGAGKTTMFRVLATLLQPTSGDVRLCGESSRTNSRRIRSLISYMPDLAPVPSDLRASEYLSFYAEAHGLRGKQREIRVTECLESVGLLERSKDICTRLSLGMRQRLALAKAMLHRPRLLILDEPASGLDPMARAELKLALRQQAESGATLILSSHVMAEIQELCTSIGLLKKGRLLDAGPIRKVLERFSDNVHRLVIRAPGNRDQTARWLAGQPGVRMEPRFPDDESIEIRIDPEVLTTAALFTSLGEARLGVTDLHAIETSVEDVVIRLGTEAPRP
jgi:ABC-2 type transport system ATP-binding protein